MGLFFRGKTKSLLYVVASATGLYAGVCIYNGNYKFYKDTLMPLVRLLDPERAHNLAVFVSQYRLLPKVVFKDPDILRVHVLGKDFPNPIGIAAGFDKDGKTIMGLKDIGFGFVEIGSVTPLPQLGNDKPRVFRLLEDRAVINRYGFNSQGHEEVLQRIKNIKCNAETPVIVGINLGKNKTSDDAVKDYVEGIEKFGGIADYLVINISSPNTPNLRTLQNKENLGMLLKAVVEAKNRLSEPKPPLLLKLAPDLNYEEKKDIAEIVKRKGCMVDGLIVCNTTVQRPKLISKYKNEQGGLSGAPLKDTSTQMIKDMSRLTNGILIIGVGGVSSGKDAYEKIKAGASLIQIYSALIYDGPPLVSQIKKELADLVAKDGFKNISEAIGKDR
ncbi:dihydroorotate dehydrogenase (quinone), mitochondrial-like [Euwallacea similis]|uniref:dihydroorotate dehydrogenase (quinone), mitochondrial-like n=1 Tax=Euwallacea similis TaxID=1736056 RepID=UPI00344BDDF6